MAANARPIPVGAHIIDSLAFSEVGDAPRSRALKASGVDGVALYLGVASTNTANAALAEGLAVFGVTLGGHYDGAAAVAQAKGLGLAQGTSLFLDLEGPAAAKADPVALAAQINAWADTVSAAGFLPCLYVGVPQPFTSDELYALKVVRYWRGQGSIRDRNGQLAEPRCGWCMTQAWPSVMCGGVLVDHDLPAHDYYDRAPVWSVAA